MPPCTVRRRWRPAPPRRQPRQCASSDRPCRAARRPRPCTRPAPRRHRRRELAGDDVGVDVQHVAARRARAEARDHRHVPARPPAPRAARRRSPSTSPTSRSRRARPPPPETTRGGRRCARMHAARAAQPHRGTPAARSAAHRSTLSLPGDDHLHHVQRRRVGDPPPAHDARLDAQPRSRAPSPAGRRRAPPPAACRPPRAPTRSRATTRQRGAASTSPPSFTTTRGSRPRPRILERQSSRAAPASGSCSGSPGRRRP